MNYKNLHDLIVIYESKIDKIYGEIHDELFKWRAMKCWRNEWYKPEESFSSFAERFNSARREFSLFIDNSRMHPSNGVIKLWEKEPETVEILFAELLMDVGKDAVAVQEKMDTFLDRYENLRQKYYPKNWSYKQDRHSASVFLAMDQPDFNYVYKSSEALTIARYIDFGYIIGSGRHFSLANYYRMCDDIVKALREHESLLEKHYNHLTDRCYQDRSLHLLAFDFMYCCKTYDYYKGLENPFTVRRDQGKRSKKYTDTRNEETEKERLIRIQELEEQLREVQVKIDEFEEISLIGVEVTIDNLVTGIITEQIDNKIIVRFPDIEKKYILDKKYKKRPRFENDEEIVRLFSDYCDAKKKLSRLEKMISDLEQ